MAPSLGLSLNTDNAEVEAVKLGGIADAAGIRAGDIILQLDGLPPMEFLAGTWWPRDGRPIVARVQRGEARVWCVILFENVPVAHPTESSGDPFAGMFQATSSAADVDEVDAVSRQVAELRRQIEGQAPTQWPQHQYGAPPLKSADQPRDDSEAERLWLEKHGRTRRDSPPMGGMQPGWSWLHTQV